MDSVWLTSEFSNAIMNSDVIDKTPAIAQDLTVGKLELVAMVQNMSGVLTNIDADNRAKGMYVLTEILKNLPNDFLNPKQLSFIEKFYIDKLKDNHRVIPAALEGFLTMIEMKYFDISLVNEFLTVLFREVPCQSQKVEDRLKIYKIIERLLYTRPELMKKSGPDFIYGLIASIEGERNPKNLLFLFNFLPKLIQNISLGDLTGDMFELISCYYPIDYTPSQEREETVTRESLSQSIAICLTAKPEFAELCLPLLIEKLDSTLRKAKIDSLKLLIESTKSFTAESLRPFLNVLWSHLHRETSNKTDEELRFTAHQALYALIEKLSLEPDETFESFVKKILITIQTELADATTTIMFEQNSRVLLTCANSSKKACIIITNAIIPSLIAFYKLNSNEKLQLLTVNHTTQFYQIARKLELVDDLKGVLQEIPHLCLEVVSVPKNRYQMIGFECLTTVIDVLPDDLVVPFIEVLSHNIHHQDDAMVLNASTKCITAIASKYPDETYALTILGKFEFNHLIEDERLLPKRLHALVHLMSVENFTDVIMNKVIEIINNKDQANIVIDVLSTYVSNEIHKNDFIVHIEDKYNLIESIVDYLSLKVADGDQKFYAGGTNLIKKIMAKLPSNKQEIIIEKYIESLMSKSLENENVIVLVASLYHSLRPEIHSKNVKDVIIYALNIALYNSDKVLRYICIVLIAHILNKADVKADFGDLLALVNEKLIECKNEITSERFAHMIELYGWLTKSLVMRGHEQYLEFLQMIMSCLYEKKTAPLACESIKLIMSDDCESLHRSFHCTVSPFYKQRLFASFFEFNFEKVERRADYLTCVAFVVGNISKNVVKAEAEKLVPLIIDVFCTDNPDLLVPILDVMTFLIEQKDKRIADSLQTILPRMLKLSNSGKSISIRKSCLDSVFKIADTYSTFLLLPFKEDVIYELGLAVDDPKRIVRAAAVRARCRWIMLGAPGED